jgi:hypothetical protein
MSQQTNSGFNAPGFSIGADDPSVGFTIAPNGKAGPRCTPVEALSRFFLSITTWGSTSGSIAAGLGQVHAIACFRIATSPAELPASLLPSLAGARLVGVGHT